MFAKSPSNENAHFGNHYSSNPEHSKPFRVGKCQRAEAGSLILLIIWNTELLWSWTLGITYSFIPTGAAVASILTLLLRRNYPEVKCFAFAPPPTLSRSALPLAIHHVFVLVYGNDSVPYLNYENVKCMVQKMVKCLNECQMHKVGYLINIIKKQLLKCCMSIERFL